MDAMEQLQRFISQVRIPWPTDPVHKRECCISFDTPRSEGGLYIDMNTFLAFGKNYVEWNYEKTGNSVYLHIHQRKKVVSEDRSLNKPTLLVSEDEEAHNIVILPDYLTLPFPSTELPEKVRFAVDAILVAEGSEEKEQPAALSTDKKKISPFASDLEQIYPSVFVPWRCAKCNQTTNLWLNLTDGSVLCGKNELDETGANSHALQHYRNTGYPLAVKLETLTADLERADVYSYPQCDSVLDPLLVDHLAFFNIRHSSWKKAKMATGERELDQNSKFDWNRIQESALKDGPLYGPGYTGLVNLGNSCYLAATMQVVISTRSFCSRYYTNQSLRMAYETTAADPTGSFNMQLYSCRLEHSIWFGINYTLKAGSSRPGLETHIPQTKLAHGLLSGVYSTVPPDKHEGITPRMFKEVISVDFLEIASMEQQDAYDFLLHFFDHVKEANDDISLDPSRSFEFDIEERTVCPSGNVDCHISSYTIFSLNIPLHEATNKEEIIAFNKMKEEMSIREKVSGIGIMRPRVPLEACLASVSAPEKMLNFYDPELNAMTTATKFTMLTSFPEYLVLHIAKFAVDKDWTPKKLDVFVDVPDIIDISHMHRKYLPPGSELQRAAAYDNVAFKMVPNEVLASEEIVSHLVSMGFPRLHCQKAAIKTLNRGVAEATEWLISHQEDADIDFPIYSAQQEAESSASLPNVDSSNVNTLISNGFQKEVALKALQGGDIEKATERILSNANVSGPVDMEATSSTSTEKIFSSGSTSGPVDMQATPSALPTPNIKISDGEGRYKLMGFVSHVGTSSVSGHYVAYIFKDGRWVLFDDDKVQVAIDPPRDTGYLYFFERLES